ncbi:HRDC domain-containing protein, partial [Deinococcus pimensis]|uniref:HRDC domain-containing protein n=1 Tax=Deinococcus pimensis TaxID=309888 RepID=UPI0005EB8923
EPERDLPPDLPEHADLPATGSADLTADLTTQQLAAFERLREWRNAEARRQEVSRFIIASNATLAELARRAPQTETELREVRGMGPERVRKYADKILNMLRGLGG